MLDVKNNKKSGPIGIICGYGAGIGIDSSSLLLAKYGEPKVVVITGADEIKNRVINVEKPMVDIDPLITKPQFVSPETRAERRVKTRKKKKKNKRL